MQHHQRSSKIDWIGWNSLSKNVMCLSRFWFKTSLSNQIISKRSSSGFDSKPLFKLNHSFDRLDRYPWMDFARWPSTCACYKRSWNHLAYVMNPNTDNQYIYEFPKRWESNEALIIFFIFNPAVQKLEFLFQIVSFLLFKQELFCCVQTKIKNIREYWEIWL